MHFEILIEDKPGEELLKILVPKIISPPNTYRIFSYKGLGRLPANLHKTPDPGKKLLLNKLPSMLRGYAKSLNPVNSAIIVVVDCDTRNCSQFKQELDEVAKLCNPKPFVFFRIASLLQKSVTFATGSCSFSPYGLQNCVFQRLLLKN
jgi:hypothetical protein